MDYPFGNKVGQSESEYLETNKNKVTRVNINPPKLEQAAGGCPRDLCYEKIKWHTFRVKEDYKIRL